MEWEECQKHKDFVFCPLSERYECIECGLSFSEEEYKKIAGTDCNYSKL